MKYMVMMFGDGGEMRASMSPEWMREMIAFMRNVDVELREAGELVLAEGLADPGEAKTVTFEHGVPVAADGPFGEARASVAGWWILEVESEARAIEFAKHIVAFTRGPIEVRQIADGPPEV